MLHKVIYTDRFIPKRYEAYTVGPLVLIRPRQLGNRGLLEHELVHVRQFWRTLGLCGIRRLLSRRYRMACEVEAYREQMRHNAQMRAPEFARYLAENYGLQITYERALEELLK
jgi:hypothetical protein